jgi:hypothetical protein
MFHFVCAFLYLIDAEHYADPSREPPKIPESPSPPLGPVIAFVEMLQATTPQHVWCARYRIHGQTPVDFACV